jgi:hypothetical protein
VEFAAERDPEILGPPLARKHPSRNRHIRVVAQLQKGAVTPSRRFDEVPTI